MLFFRWFFDSVFPALLSLIDFVYYLVSTPISSLISSWTSVNVPDWVADFGFMSFSIFDLSFGVALGFFIVYTLLKWLTALFL